MLDKDKLEVDGLCGKIELMIPAKAYFLYSVASHSSENFVESLETFMLEYAEKEFNENPELGAKLWQYYLKQAEIYQLQCIIEHQADVKDGHVREHSIPELIPVDASTSDGEYWYVEARHQDSPEPPARGREFDSDSNEPYFPSNE